MAEGLRTWPERLPPWLGLLLAAAGANAVWLDGWPGFGVAAAVLSILQASLPRGLRGRLARLGRFALYGLAFGLLRLVLALPAGALSAAAALDAAADALRLPLAVGLFQVLAGHFGLGHCRRLVAWLPAAAARQAALAIWLPGHLSRRLPELCRRWRLAAVRAGGGRKRPAALQLILGLPAFLPWLWRELEGLADNLERRWPDGPPAAAID